MIDLGHGVQLRSLREGDLEFAFHCRNDRRVWKWTRQNDLLTWEAHCAWYQGLEARPDVRMYAIGAKDIQGTLGVCGFTSIDPLNRRAEFSLYIDPEHHGCGHGTKALKTLVAHGFLNLGLNSVWGETFAENPAAQMFERVGFKHEGTRREFYFRDGKHIDAHLYSMLRREWDELRKA